MLLRNVFKSRISRFNEMGIKIFDGFVSFLAKRPFLSWALTIIYAGIIFYFSAQVNPLGYIPGFITIPSIFKHVAEYTGLGFLLFASFLGIGKGKKASLILAVAIAAIYGLSDEVHQYFVPGRVYDIVDWAADATGGIIGSFFGFSQKK